MCVMSTEQRHKIRAVIPVEATEGEILQRAASVNYLADFSIAEALVFEAKRRGLKSLPAEKFESVPGKEAKALINGMEVRVGSPRLLVEERIAVPVSFAEEITTRAHKGELIIVVLSGRSLSGAIAFSSMEESEMTVSNIEQEKMPPHRHALWLTVLVTCFSILALFLVLHYLL